MQTVGIIWGQPSVKRDAAIVSGTRLGEPPWGSPRSWQLPRSRYTGHSNWMRRTCCARRG